MSRELFLRDITSDYGVINRHLVIIACIDKAIIQTFFSDWPWLNLGLKLSAKLLEIPKEKRPDEIVNHVRDLILDSSEERMIIENIDLLFSPEYALNVLKLFSMLGKTKKLVIVWDGVYKEGVLTYSQPDLPDYHHYDLNEYDAYCITK